MTREQEPGTRTLPTEDSRPRKRCAHLHLVLEAARPWAGGTSHALCDLDEVKLGRGPERTIAREGRRLIIQIPDEWMSGRHAVLRTARGHWEIEDVGSKNKVRVNGVKQERAILGDGDRIELGGTSFLYRADAPVLAGAPDRASSDLRGPRGLVTLLPELAEQFDKLRRIAPTLDVVLLQGPTGSGKEMVAQAVHELSGRKPFVPVNCGELSEALAAGQLFGHVKGAFTGADQDRKGLIETSSGGTLFLDEIGELSPPVQVMLLRALQEKQVLPVGATQPRSVDLRVVAATNRDLAVFVRADRFRHDLLSRLGGLSVQLPPLAARRMDLGLLIAALLERIARDEPVRFTAEAMRMLLSHDWPENVRGLEKILGVALSLARDPQGKLSGPIRLEHLPSLIAPPPPPTEPAPPPTEPPPTEPAPPPTEPAPPPTEPPSGAKAQAQKQQLIEAMCKAHGIQREAAKLLGVSRVEVYRLEKKYGVDHKDFRKSRQP